MLYVGKPPYSTNAADYDAAAKMLKAVRPYVTRFSSSGYINDLAGGSLCAVMGYSGDINIARARALEANPKQPAAIEALIPKGGATLFFDTMAIPKDAQNVANAHLFINYILRPEVAAALTNKVFYANPNAASLKFVKKDVAENKTIFLSAADKARMTPPDAVPQAIRRVQTRIFTNFKAGTLSRGRVRLRSGDLDALPEGDAALDLLGGLARLRVVPDRVLVQLAVDQQAVVVRLAFPRAAGAVVAEGDVLALQARLGEVVVAFDDDGVVALGDRGAVPGGFHGGPW